VYALRGPMEGRKLRRGSSLSVDTSFDRMAAETERERDRERERQREQQGGGDRVRETERRRESDRERRRRECVGECGLSECLSPSHLSGKAATFPNESATT
jgi:hypothetical protein